MLLSKNSTDHFLASIRQSQITTEPYCRPAWPKLCETISVHMFEYKAKVHSVGSDSSATVERHHHHHQWTKHRHGQRAKCHFFAAPQLSVANLFDKCALEGQQFDDANEIAATAAVKLLRKKSSQSEVCSPVRLATNSDTADTNLEREDRSLITTIIIVFFFLSTLKNSIPLHSASHDLHF